MPVAILIADRGDTRDAVGLYLAGRGWTTVPIAPDPGTVRSAVADLAPGLVAIDFRGQPAGAAGCLTELAGAGVPIYLLNAPDAVASDTAHIIRATGPEDIPDAPGQPASPHHG
jgi:hypothetical protein